MKKMNGKLRARSFVWEETDGQAWLLDDLHKVEMMKEERDKN
jgi:hypothetical protein